MKQSNQPKDNVDLTKGNVEFLKDPENFEKVFGQAPTKEQLKTLEAIQNGAVEPIKVEVAKLQEGVRAYYKDGVAVVDVSLVNNASKSNDGSWDLMYTLAHENGHHLAHLLGIESVKAEVGTNFANAFVLQNNLLKRNDSYSFATIGGRNYNVELGSINRHAKALEMAIFATGIGNGSIDINGQTVHAFKIVMPDIHEQLQGAAAYKAWVNPEMEFKFNPGGAIAFMLDKAGLDFIMGDVGFEDYNYMMGDLVEALPSGLLSGDSSILSVEQMHLGAKFNDQPEGFVEMIRKLTLREYIFAKPSKEDLNFMSSGMLARELMGLVARSYIDSSETGKSHYGSNQWMHAMISKEGSSNADVRDQIVDGLVDWYQQALTEGHTPDGFFLIGRISHTIADSYAGGHVTRNERGEVVFFHNYEEPSQHVDSAHSSWDVADNIGGIRNAFDTLTTMNTMFKNRASADTFRNFLLDNVFNIQSGFEALSGSSQKIIKRQ